MVIAVVVAAVVAAGVGVGLAARSDPGVDATTTDAPAAEPLGDDPPASPTRLLWSGDLRAERLIVHGAYVVAADGRGVAVHDLATGDERWHYREDGRLVEDAATDVRVTGDLVEVEYLEGDSSTGTQGRVAFDVASGRVLDEGYRDDEVGDVEVSDPGPRLRGLAAADGDELWTWAPDDRCPAGTEQAAGAADRSADTFVVELRCEDSSGGAGDGTGSTLAAVDVATGEVLWREPLPPGGSLVEADEGWVHVAVDGGTTESRPLRTGRVEPRSTTRPLPGTPTFPVAGGRCTVTGLEPDIRCADADGRPLGAQPLAPPGAPVSGVLGWLPASAADTLVLVSEAASDESSLLAVYRPAESDRPVLEARLDDAPAQADQLVYQPGALVLTSSTGHIAVYTDP